MTGFSRREAEISPYGKMYLEAVSLNHRYLDVDVKVPKFLSFLQFPISELVKGRFSRGKFTISLRFLRYKKLPFRLVFNEDLLKEYTRYIEYVEKKFRLFGSLSVSDVINLDGVFSLESEVPEEDVEKAILKEVEKLLAELEGERMREGENLTSDIKERIATIERIKDEIKSLSGVQVEEARKNILSRVKELLEDTEIDEGRIEQEISFLAARMDVTEELVRIESHLSSFKETLKMPSPVGRRLDFLCQELLREINTVGSKAYLPEISRKVVDFKDELEKIRQQVQNLE